MLEGVCNSLLTTTYNWLSVIFDIAGELPRSAILSEGRYSPTWRYGFYVEHGCGDLACWFRRHARPLIDQK
jgi:hypothetical protein